jgi:hypothetical protein
VEKAIKEMRDKKATGDDGVPVAVLKLLGKDGPELMIQLINNIYKNVEQPKEFAEVTMITLKKPKATKCRNHHTITQIAHAAKTGTRILRKGLKTRVRMLGEDQFGFRRGKETRGATGMLRVSKCTLDIDEEVCACFTDWQKASDCLNWAKLMQILDHW